MKKSILLIAALMLLSGCGNKEADNKKPPKEPVSATETQKDKKEASKPEAKEEKQPAKTEKIETDKVTAENLADMINKANDENTDEETKREILDEIDAILKQAEQNAN